MSLILHKPSYPCEPITTIKALSNALGFDEKVLHDIAAKANGMYRRVKPKPGSTRETFDANGLLKEIHQRIKLRILVRVYFPDYLHGSIRGRDYFTNAKLHSNKQILICEDVKKFFPSVRTEKVYDVWRGFFNFSGPVAALLTQLTTKDGALPQGAIPSSYLANLVLWKVEPFLQAKLTAQGITYSRYVDDMAMSSASYLNKAQQNAVIAQVYGMLSKAGLRAGRGKHEIFAASKPMIVTKLVVNRKPSWPTKKRSAVRAQVFHLEQIAVNGEPAADTLKHADKAAQRVGQLGRFHRTEGNALKVRVRAARSLIQANGIEVSGQGNSTTKLKDT
ncbi:MAG: reverse transcriptase family protein [Polaromonas sp.]|nr:reverse transcriptase family protein [Polaromonas sp.]